MLETAGVGIQGVVDGSLWQIRSGGDDAVHVVGSDGPRGIIRFGDRMRDDSAETVGRLRELGLEVSIVSGDEAEPTLEIAKRVGADSSWAGQRPDAKVERIRGWQEAGETVLYAGDGLNDGPALASADVAIAMGGRGTPALK